jgi:hypothetical protein
MEKTEREKIESAVGKNFELRRLYLRHRRLESRLDSLRRRSFLTSAEELEEKKLKAEKLNGKEKMMALIRQVGNGQ